MYNKNPTSRRLIPGCLLTGIGLILIFAMGAYFVHPLVRIDVDPDKTRPVVVSAPSHIKISSNDTELSSLPDGAITASITQQVIDSADHPFDPLLKLADDSIDSIDRNIRDYTATLVSQVFVDGKLQPEKYLKVKIRHANTRDGIQTPFSVYTCFLKPKENVGQEVIWVAGQNDGNIVAHTTGLLNVKRFYLDPDGSIAMEGNRYPIGDIGMRNLIVKMREFGEKDRQHGECIVKIQRNVEINGCTCTRIQAAHPYQRDHFDFHIARIYIDDARNIPIAYEGYLWPDKEGEPAPLLEKYYYTDVKLNIGLTDEDFDASNKAYNFPNW